MLITPAEVFIFSHDSLLRALQMQDALADLLGTALVPELGPDVSAGTAGDAHAGLVAVAADRALPDQLAGIVLDDHDLSVIAVMLS